VVWEGRSREASPYPNPWPGSSGMIVRLAFSVAINVDPDILIIDEVLAVGDASFQEKCFERVRGFRRAGKTFLCVSHNKGMLMETLRPGHLARSRRSYEVRQDL